MKNKKLFFILFTLLLFISLFFTLYTESFGADPKLISTLKKAFEKIEDWLVKIATPAAAVAVGTGLLMKKFSFGDEEKIRRRAASTRSWRRLRCSLYGCRPAGKYPRDHRTAGRNHQGAL